MGKLTGLIKDLVTCKKQKRDLEKNIALLRKDHTKILQNHRDILKYENEVKKVISK